MSTSLAKQLQRLSAVAAPDAAKPVSLLFSQKEATRLDLDDVFDLGVNGLMELAQLDPRFGAFHESLLSPQGRRTDRAGQSAEENRQLDQLILQLCLALSPYFMLRPAHKVIEWLLRRFHVHRLNVPAVMACLLPFHETSIAARLVQLLAIENTMFSFFGGVKKTGAPMPRSVLIERCVHSTNFLPFVYEMLTKSVALDCSSRPLCSLWSSMCVGVLRLRPSEEVVRAVLAMGIDAVSPQHKDDNVRAGGLMALAQICASSTLEQQALDLVVDAFVSAEELSGLCLVFQTQPKARLTSIDSVASLLSSKLGGQLCAVADKCDASALLTAILRAMLAPELVGETAVKIVKAWLTLSASLAPRIESSFVAELVRDVLLRNAHSSALPASAYIRQCLAPVLSSLGADAGAGVAGALGAAGENPEIHYRVEQLAIDIFGQISSHSPLPGTGTTLLLSLSHPESRVRQTGLSLIDKEVRAKRLDVNHALVQNACLLVHDSDLQIAEAILSYPWFPQAIGAGLWDVLKPVLAEPRLVRVALPVALGAKLPLAVPTTVKLVTHESIVTGNNLDVNEHVLRACQQANTADAHALVVAIAAAAQQVSSTTSSASKKQKSSAQSSVAQALILSLAAACKENFDECWPVLVKNLGHHALILVCRQLLFKWDGSDQHRQTVTNVAAEILVKVSNSHTFPGNDDSGSMEWSETWVSHVSTAAAACLSLLLERGALVNQTCLEQVFLILCRMAEGDRAAALFAAFLGRLSAPLDFICGRMAEQRDELVAIRALHVAEAAFQGISSSKEVAADLPFWLASLCVPLQSDSERLRKAALRCIARLVKVKASRGDSHLVSLVKAVDTDSSKVKSSPDSIATTFASTDDASVGGGKKILEWVVSSLSDPRISGQTRVALLRSVRLVSHSSRLGLFSGTLQKALASGNVSEARPLLSGMSACADSVGKDEGAVQLLVSALESKVEDICMAALDAISPALWNGLDGNGKRAILAGLCQAAASGQGNVPATAARITREIGAARGTNILAAELHLNLETDKKGGGGGSASKRARQGIPTGKLVAELSRLEVVLELLRASRGGDAFTASALLSLLGELTAVAAKDASVEYTMQLALATLGPLVEDRTAVLVAEDVDVLLSCLYANHSPNLRSSIMSLLSASADVDPMPVARQIMMLFRTDDSMPVAVDNKTSFRIMQGLLAKVLPHLSVDHCSAVLRIFVQSLPTIPSHRRLILLESAANHLPGKPLGKLLALLLLSSDPVLTTRLDKQDSLDLSSTLCASLGPVLTAQGLVDFVSLSDGVDPTAPQFVAHCLSSDAFVHGCVALKSEKDQDRVQESLGALFHLLLGNIAKGQAAVSLKATYDSIDAINELFSIPHFISVVQELLLRHSDTEVRRRATVVLNERIRSHRAIGLTTVEENAFVGLMPALQSLLTAKSTDESLLQAALLSLDILGRSFGPTHPQPVLAALREVLSLVSLTDMRKQHDLYASGILAISALCSRLGPLVLPVLPMCIAPQLQVLSRGTGKKTPEDLTFSALSSLLEICVHLGEFLSPHAKEILEAVVSLAALTDESSAIGKRSRQVCASLAEHVEPRLLAPVLLELVSPSNKGPLRSQALAMEILVGCAAQASSYTSRPSDLGLLWNVCVAAAEAAESEVVQEAADAAAEVAFHLSEAAFKPLFLALLGSAESIGKQPIIAVGASLLNRLKSLAVPWCARIVPLAIEVLEGENGSASVQAVEFVRLLCLNDMDGELNKDVLASLIDPLVDVVEVAGLAILELAVLMNGDSLWRPLNSALVLKLRDPSSMVRRSVLQTMNRLWERFGEDFLMLLPDVMPGLAEVMEDVDEDVVRDAQALLATINALLPNAITF